MGAVGYYLLTGDHVFRGETVMEVCLQHLEAEPEPPSQRLGKPVPAAVEELVLDCLAKKPAERPQSALEVQDRLRDLSLEPAWDAQRARAWWRARGAALRALHSPEPVKEAQRTMAVDHEQRT